MQNLNLEVSISYHKNENFKFIFELSVQLTSLHLRYLVTCFLNLPDDKWDHIFTQTTKWLSELGMVDTDKNVLSF